MTRVLVTGGCGFIGVNLVSYLLDHSNWAINVLDDLSEGKLEYLERLENYDTDRVDFFPGDVRDSTEVATSIEGCQYVVHLAAKTDVISSVNNPFEDADVNIMGTINVLEAALGQDIKRFVFASSAAPLGDQEQPVDESKIPQPLSPYGASKLAGEGYCSAYAGSHGLSTVALRFSNVYGPNSWHKGSVVSLFIKQIIAGRTPVIYGNGKQTRDFVHTHDISNAVYLSLTRDLPSTYQLFQLGTGTETSVNQLYAILGKYMEEEGFHVPRAIYAEARAGEIFRSYCDISRAADILGYHPVVDMEEGVARTVDWFRDDYRP